MIIQNPNFITDEEKDNLLSLLNLKIQGETFYNLNFYHWIEINKTDYSENRFIEKILSKHIDHLNKTVEKRNWKVEYCGFAYQTQGFAYHADAVWPSQELDRNLGTPKNDGSGFIHYEGDWVPNYVPERYFTTVLFLNEVVGGETHFPNLDIKLVPEPKKLIGFHCDENHIHGVMPTTKGVRKTFIVWFE